MFHIALDNGVHGTDAVDDRRLPSDVRVVLGTVDCVRNVDCKRPVAAAMQNLPPQREERRSLNHTLQVLADHLTNWLTAPLTGARARCSSFIAVV